MQVRQCQQKLFHEKAGLFLRQFAPALQQFVEGLLGVLHDQSDLAVLAVDVVQLDDILMA